MIIDFEAAFDGHRVVGAGRLTVSGERIERIDPPAPQGAPAADHRCRLLLPGLVDAHAAVFGYQERPPEVDPFQPHRRALALHLSSGVTTVRDPGNSFEALAYLRAVAAPAGGPRLAASGPVLDGLPLSRLTTRLVCDPGDVKRAIGTAVAEGALLVSIGRNLAPPLVAECVAMAHHAGLPVALETGVCDPETAVAAGVDAIEYLPRFRPVSAEPLEQLLAWNDAGVQARAAALVPALADRGVAVCPMLVATRRRLVLKEAINDPDLDQVIPILPYHRHLASMRTSVGYAIGRRILNDHIAVPALDKSALEEVRAAFEQVDAWLLALHAAGVPVLAGSGSPGISAIPGYGLYREVHRLTGTGLSTSDALAAATRLPAAAVRRPDLGVLAPGATADLLLLDADPGTDVLGWAHADKVVLTGGRVADAALLATPEPEGSA